MKKCFILLVMTVYTINLVAQEGDIIPIADSSYRIYLGPKVGVNFSSMSMSGEGYSLSTKSGLGFLGGLSANFHFGRRTPKSDGGTGLFGLQVEALYSQRMIKIETDNLKHSCFEVPILAQCYVMPGFSIEVGPTVVGILNSSSDVVSGNTVISFGEMKGFDVMLTAGVGYKHHSGFTASARYNRGMSKVAGNFDGKVSTFAISIGWLFSLLK